MGVIGDLLAALFGGGRNVVRETVGIFAENAEAAAERSAGVQRQAMREFAAEFVSGRRGAFDRFVDGLNRLPRPALALGTLGLFVAAMVDPIWFAARMQGIALVPEPLWWLLGVIVSFYFGARHQAKTQELQREIAATFARTPVAMANLAALERLSAEWPDAAGSEGDGVLAPETSRPDPNPALEDWRALRRQEGLEIPGR